MKDYRLDRYKEELSKAKKNLKEAEKRYEYFNNLSFNKQLAIILHDSFCTHNHTDGCSWYYYNPQKDINIWENNSPYSYWLKKAHKFIKECEEIGITVDQGIKFKKRALCD